MDLMTLAGQYDNGYACVYHNCLSWSSPTTPLPSEAHPRVVFDRLFGDGATGAERRAALRSRASLLDSVMEEFARLNNQLGPADRARVGQYLDSIREVERRIQRAEANASADPDRDVAPRAPSWHGTPDGTVTQCSQLARVRAVENRMPGSLADGTAFPG